MEVVIAFVHLSVGIIAMKVTQEHRQTETKIKQRSSWIPYTSKHKQTLLTRVVSESTLQGKGELNGDKGRKHL